MTTSSSAGSGFEPSAVTHPRRARRRDRALDATHHATRVRPRIEPGALPGYAAERLETLCRAAGFGEHSSTAGATFRRLLSDSFIGTRLGATSWASEISDDNTPVEFSVAISNGRAEVRALFEPRGKRPTVDAYRTAGIELNRSLEQHHGADLSRFRAVQDLFLPRGMQGPFAVWSSAVFSSTGGTSFKAYFNTQARGLDQSEALVEEGLRRFGLQRAWQRLRATALRRGSSLDELKYFALDLTSGPEARIKVYVRHHEATLNDLELAASAAASYRPGEALEFARAMRGNTERLHARAGFSCSSFTSKGDECPTATTVYVPVCAYARDDAAVTRRIHDYLVAQGLDPAPYDAIMRGFANRALDAGVGMQSWAAFRRHDAQARLTVYLATEANRVHAPGEVPAPTPDRSRFLAASTRHGWGESPSRAEPTGEGSTRCEL